MAPSPWQPVAGATYVGTAASTRFPVYTRGNAGEVYPDVVYPLTFSTAIARAEQAWIDAMVDTGLFSHAELAGEQAITSGVFGGYAYLNLSFARVASARIAGASATDVDDTVFGLSDATQIVRHGPLPVRSGAAPRGPRLRAASCRSNTSSSSSSTAAIGAGDRPAASRSAWAWAR